MAAKKEEQILYSVPKTHMWFAITSIVLLGSLIWMSYQDYVREWKNYQKEFIVLKVSKLNQQLEDASKKVDPKKLAELQTQYQEAKKKSEQNKKTYVDLQDNIAGLTLAIKKVIVEYQDLKQFQDSYRYYYEEYHHQNNVKAEEYSKKLAENHPKLIKLKMDMESLETEKDNYEKQIKNLDEEQKSIQKQLNTLLSNKSRIELKINSAKPTLAKDILNAPMVDFIAPSLQIQQIVLENLTDDYYFSKPQKVDRCTTCHLGIDQPEFADAPQPFKTHPNLDLFLSSKSPHSIEQIGCTVCHEGSGNSVDFTWSAHTPKNDTQAKEWKEKYHWHPLHKWDAKMLPLQHTEASCTKCHRNTERVPEAKKLNEGRHLAETLGCYNCHKVVGFEKQWKVGPSLLNIKSKVNKDWIIRWLDNPKSFRHSTNMPSIFNLENTQDPQSMERNKATIEAIATYLTQKSDATELEKPMVNVDPTNGEKLIKEVGCLACHSIKGTETGKHGPELSGLGSKVSPEWLYTWIKNPKHFSPNTRMPNLRLSDQEASDITSFLLQDKNSEFEQKIIPEVRPDVLDELVMINLQKTMRHVEAEQKIKNMSHEDKLNYLGKEAIKHQGCFSCHNIKEFESTPPIATELTKEAQKAVDKLDFGFIDTPKNRHDWFFQKLKNPRIFDRGRVKEYYEKLRMPDFGLTDQEAESLTTFILSLHDHGIPLEAQRKLDLKDQAIEKGHFLVNKLNCTGCHTLDGQEGLLRKMAEDPGNAPPILEGEGAKVQAKWLHDFLKNPFVIRPWLKYRMPTFQFTDEEAQTLVQYFTYQAHQDISYQDDATPQTDSATLADGQKLFELLRCIQCHNVDQSTASLGSSFLAPDLAIAKHRLKSDWVLQWLHDPQKLQPGTQMPTFFIEDQSPLPDILGGNADAQIKAMRDYLFQYKPKETQ